MKKNIKGGSNLRNNVSAQVQQSTPITRTINSVKSIGLSGALIIIMVVLMLIGLYYFYKNLNKDRTDIGVKTERFLTSIHDAKTYTKIGHGSLPASSQGNEYNYNFWIYVNDYNYKHNDFKFILNKSEVGYEDYSNPGVFLMPGSNTLRVQVGLETLITNCEKFEDFSTDEIKEYFQNDKSSQSSSTTTPTPTPTQAPTPAPVFTTQKPVEAESEPETMIDYCDIENIDLQRWLNLNITVTNNILDIYINGKLVKTCALKGFPKKNKGSLHICNNGGFNGYIVNLRYSNRAISYNDIRKYYENGPMSKGNKFLNIF
mgnify:CR=1 FL=1